TVKLLDLTEGRHIEREMMLIKVRAVKEGREELKRLTDIFRAKIIDVTETSYVVELTGTSQKLDAFIQAVPEGLVVEVVRSGPTGIARGEKGLTL
ncbi:MAG: acetolactate synthase small subunit, partial [Chromatiaceae bacterium]|nr:acetolactate synthase small subunit [Chromatiaceae bacterium]